MFELLYVRDDEIIASDLQPAFRNLVSSSLARDLASERKTHQNTFARAKDFWVVSEGTASARSSGGRPLSCPSSHNPP